MTKIGPAAVHIQAPMATVVLQRFVTKHWSTGNFRTQCSFNTANRIQKYCLMVGPTGTGPRMFSGGMALIKSVVSKFWIAIDVQIATRASRIVHDLPGAILKTDLKT